MTLPSRVSRVSLWALVKRFRWRISLTLALVLLEATLAILYPLCIGLAINGLLEDRLDGLVVLAALGIASTVIGSARRFYDTRIYAGIYRTVAPEVVTAEQARGSDVSRVAARAGLLTEFVEFMENALPELVFTAVSLTGVLIIISTLNLAVFQACLGVLALIAVLYLASGRCNYRLNAAYNDELERRVRSLASTDPDRIRRHFSRLMAWNIRLSDLESGNYLVIWLAVVGLFVFTPLSAVSSGPVNYGMVFSLLMYVFDYIEAVTGLPLFVQQLIRLKEISTRLRSPEQSLAPAAAEPTGGP